MSSVGIELTTTRPLPLPLKSNGVFQIWLIFVFTNGSGLGKLAAGILTVIVGIACIFQIFTGRRKNHRVAQEPLEHGFSQGYA